MEELVEHRRRVLVVQATGWGKSAVYWGATAALRERGAGPTLVISPLLALMRDQIAAAEVLWLPREHQLREMLGSSFLSLARVGEEYVVTLADGVSYAADDVETAYAFAVLG